MNDNGLSDQCPKCHKNQSGEESVAIVSDEDWQEKQREKWNGIQIESHFGSFKLSVLFVEDVKEYRHCNWSAVVYA